MNQTRASIPRDLFHRMSFQMLDNETSKALNIYYKNQTKVTSTMCNKTLIAIIFFERSIEDRKAHFIVGLATIDLSFRIEAWSELVYQGKITSNNLRT